MRFVWIWLPLALVGRSAFGQERSTDQHAVPVFREPRHHVVYESPLVRLLDVRVPPGDTTLYHVHADRHIGVVISGARTWGQIAGQPASAVDSVADAVGALFDNTTSQLSYTHRVGNADSVAFRYLVAQLLSSPGRDAPVLPASSGLGLDRETARARVYRVTLAPGQATPVHRHVQPGLTVQVGPGVLRLPGTAPEAASLESGAGGWWWRGADTQHLLRNAGERTIEVVEIDWR